MEIKEILKDKKNLLIIGLIVIIILLFILLMLNINKDSNIKRNLYDVSAKSNDNFVFLGDSITERFPLEEFFDNLPVINSGVGGDQTTDLLESINTRVSIYNPTKVFVLIGTNDINTGRSNDEIVKNIQKIIKEINKSRPHATIFLQSIYPVNNTDDEKIDRELVGKRNNEDIKKINNDLKKYCEQKELCTYINMFDQLIDNDGNLELKYTTEGLHISNLGYIKVTRKLLEYFH